MSSLVRFGCTLALVFFAGVAAAQDKTPLPVGSPPAPTPPDPKAVAATVNGTPIFERAVFRAVSQAPLEKRAAARDQVLNFLIDNALVDQYLDQLKIAVEPKELDDAVEDLKKEILSSGGKFDEMLDKLILTTAELRDQLGAELRWRKFLDKYAPKDVLAKFFDANKNFFDGSQVRARHLLVPAKRDDAKEVEAGRLKIAFYRKQIEEKAAQELAKGPPPQDNLEKEKARAKALEAAFVEIASKESSCPTKADGGEVGWFARTGRMVEPFARAAFAVKPFQLSDPVISEFGCHLILATDTRPGREVNFEDMKDVVKEVYADRMREAVVARARPTARIAMAPK